jgi:glutamine synthetase
MNAPEPTDDLATLFHREGVRDVECLFADVTGYPRGKLMPAQRFAQGQELRIAQAVPMQCVTGQYSYDPIFPDADPDVRLVPDPATLRRVPWSSVPRYLALHDCVETDGRPCAFAPRSVLQSVLERYRAQGLTPVVAPEIEFYLVAAHVDPAQPLQAPPGRSGRAESGHSAFSLNQLNELAPFWDEFHAALDTLQIATDTWIHEVGATQYEINLQHGNALAVADQAFLFKFAAKEVALRHGLNAVFMAKPMAGQPGSSMHLHQSVVDADGHNVFSRSDGSASPRHGQFIAGLQAYTPELMLMHAPSVNSFRRYVAGSQAPLSRACCCAAHPGTGPRTRFARRLALRRSATRGRAATAALLGAAHAARRRPAQVLGDQGGAPPARMPPGFLAAGGARWAARWAARRRRASCSDLPQHV